MPEDDDLIEPDGVNAGPPVDSGGRPAHPGGSELPAGPAGPGPDPAPQGQGHGELLSDAGSHNGLSEPGPGQEMSAGEG